jgi:MFS family permease
MQSLLRLRKLYAEYPRQFWTLAGAAFIDSLGAAFMFPFFTLYITKKFSVGMTEVGLLFACFSISGVIGSTLGGALTDRFGRKGIIIFGLMASALSSLLMGVVDSFALFLASALFVGLFARTGEPAHRAMVADLLPEGKVAQGFAIMRVIHNIAVAIGPAIGGLLVARSYLSVFLADAIASTITAGVVLLALPETKPAGTAQEPSISFLRTFAGYGDVLRNAQFVWFMACAILVTLASMQLFSTLPVYLRDVHGIPDQNYGYIMSLNASMVVLFQFPISRWISRYRPLRIMSAGALFYAMGLFLYGIVSAYPLFFLGMAIATIGEMLVSPTSQGVVAQTAPPAMRGRYMAVFGLTWSLSSAIGPTLAGLIMDHADPVWVWYAAATVGVLAATGFAVMQQRRARAALREQPAA